MVGRINLLQEDDNRENNRGNNVRMEVIEREERGKGSCQTSMKVRRSK